VGPLCFNLFDFEVLHLFLRTITPFSCMLGVLVDGITEYSFSVGILLVTFICSLEVC
jgi:hypothetical protein